MKMFITLIFSMDLQKIQFWVFAKDFDRQSCALRTFFMRQNFINFWKIFNHSSFNFFLNPIVSKKKENYNCGNNFRNS